MCVQWTHVLCSVVITLQSNSRISQISRSCNEFTSVWSMFLNNTIILMHLHRKKTCANSSDPNYSDIAALKSKKTAFYTTRLAYLENTDVGFCYNI